MRKGVALCHEAVNTSLTEWRFTGDEWRLVRYNDAAHAMTLSAPGDAISRTGVGSTAPRAVDERGVGHG